ncbi:MAG: hypothetical protein CVV64_06225 [Candidatus Wallbacteria bacterium HGW-Wallbacteria-1]|jgi:hypothetical protein|uniref:Uncharacterized protein n=1 Tax=Candidatus Wallbacteria bacterium HGW-Wallbacteria-1 TaxID=2013854 RepID=A0A2N1PSP5_9BACT|nr:MAG: hypothetical protein CVV64_06225 [Candidatus Wallbacteria bacterium HGW-Wallbacteria-1]
MGNNLFFGALIIIASLCISGCGGASGDNYLDMAFDDDKVVSSVSIAETGWNALASGDPGLAMEKFYAGLAAAPEDPLVEASLREGLGWAQRDLTGIESGMSQFEKAAPWTMGGRIGLAYSYISRGASGDVDRAVKQFEASGMADADAVFVPERSGTTRDVEVHAMAAMAFFLRGNPGDREKARSHVIRVRQLLASDYSKAADDLVQALEKMGLNAS